VRRAALPLAALLATACASPSTTGPSPAPVPARSYAAHPGFDSYYYPGDSALRAWRAPASPYRWVGYYLAAPCHRESSWSGRRPTIEALGWGIAVLYVGQQTWEGQAQVAPPDVPPSAAVTTAPSPADTLPRAATAAATAPPACAVSELTAARGTADGADAVARAAAEGFAAGTVIFLDVERMERIPQAMHDYHRAWVRAVVADGRFRPGLYCHTRNAAELHAAVQAELAAAGVAAPPHVWVASGTGFDVTKRPEEVGHPFATVWQGAFDVRETWGGVTLRIDANVARTPSPSSP
jgi:hypothetical protein